jgi:hypothetical protein
MAILAGHGDYPHRAERQMIRIEISAAAYAAISAGVAEHSRLPAQPSPSGGFYLWLDKNTLNRLTAARGPAEGFSETILRLAVETEAA